MTGEEIILVFVLSTPAMVVSWLLWKLRAPSRRVRQRYWDYRAEALAAGRTPGPDLEVEARGYAYRRRRERQLEDDK